MERITGETWRELVGRSLSRPRAIEGRDVDDLLFEVSTPLGFVVRCTRAYWQFIASEKHPVMDGREKEVKEALADPDEIRRSRKDAAVFLFYRGRSPRWLCAVTRREDGSGFLITAYPTDAIKAGEVVWTRSR